MRKILLIISFLSVYLFSNAQIDAIKIASAKKAFENKDYSIAISTLDEVTTAGRQNKMFDYYKGFSYYKLNQFDSAEVYLKKYLIKDINNTETAEALVDIDYQRKKLAVKEKDRLKYINNVYSFFGLHGDIKSFKETVIGEYGYKRSYEKVLDIVSCLMTYNDKRTYQITYTINYIGLIRKSEFTEVGGDSDSPITTYYEYKDNLQTKSSYRFCFNGDCNDYETVYSYDQNGFCIKSIYYKDQMKFVETTYTNNSLGLPTSSVAIKYNDSGLSISTNSNNYTYKYDTYNNWIEKVEVSSDGKTTMYYREIEYN